MSVLALALETPRVSAVSWAVTNGLSTLIACAIGFSINPGITRGKAREPARIAAEIQTYARPSGRAGWSRPSGLHNKTFSLTGFSPRGTSADKADHPFTAQMQGWKPCSTQLAGQTSKHGFEPCLISPKTDLSFWERSSHPLKTAKGGAASFVVIRSEKFGEGGPARQPKFGYSVRKEFKGWASRQINASMRTDVVARLLR
jgi:hypothetical protein